jgi:hypothetical protein
LLLLEPYSGHSPPPSFGGWPSANQPRDLRLFGLASCALAPPTRRWRGNHPVPGRARARAKARGRKPSRFRGCSVRAGSHLLARRAGMLRQAFGRDRIPPSRPRSRRLTLCAASTRRSVFVRRQPSRRASPPSSPSSPPMRCPGSGLQRSRRLSASKPLRSPRQSRGTTASPHPASGGKPAFAPTATCWLVKCRDVAVSTRTKAPEGLESCRRGGAS